MTEERIVSKDKNLSSKMQHLLTELGTAIHGSAMIMEEIAKQGEEDGLTKEETRALIWETFDHISYRTFMRCLPDRLKDKKQQERRAVARVATESLESKPLDIPQPRHEILEAKVETKTEIIKMNPSKFDFSIARMNKSNVNLYCRDGWVVKVEEI
jgi:hypothetical protein